MLEIPEFPDHARQPDARFGARFEVERDNMRHAGTSGNITLDVYSKTTWKERVEAVSRVVEAVFAEHGEPEEEKITTPLKETPVAEVAKTGNRLGLQAV